MMPFQKPDPKKTITDIINNSKSKRELIENISKQHPEWGGDRIATEVGCNSRYAYRILKRIKEQPQINPPLLDGITLSDSVKDTSSDEPSIIGDGLFKDIEKPKKELEFNPKQTSPDIFIPKKRSIGIVMADIHSPYYDEEAMGICVEHTARLDPDYLILNGDFADFYQVSSWGKDPTRPSFPDEVEHNRKILNELGSFFPKSKKFYIEGNHEYRLNMFLMNRASALYGLDCLTVTEILQTEKAGFNYVVNRELLQDKGEPFKIGKLYFLHGHEVRCSYTSVNIARIYYLKCQVNLMVAHHHQLQEYTQKKLNNRREGCWSTGCLCELSADYSPVNNWTHGFAIIEWNDDGSFLVQNRQIIDGRVL